MQKADQPKIPSLECLSFTDLVRITYITVAKCYA
jgi:hypothetical protein